MRCGKEWGLNVEVHPPTGLAPRVTLGLPVLSETKLEIPARSFAEGCPHVSKPVRRILFMRFLNLGLSPVCEIRVVLDESSC
jgi:hypothetical protein